MGKENAPESIKLPEEQEVVPEKKVSRRAFIKAGLGAGVLGILSPKELAAIMVGEQRIDKRSQTVDDCIRRMADGRHEIKIVPGKNIEQLTEKFARKERNGRKFNIRPDSKNTSLLAALWRLKNLRLPDGRSHLQMVEQVCRSYNAPFDLVFLAMHESSWRSEARSYAGAGGYWQFIPPTARACGLRINGSVDDRADPEKSTQAAVRHLLYLKNKMMTVKKRGIIPLSEPEAWAWAFSAYNGGFGNAMRRFKIVHGDFNVFVQSTLNRENRMYYPKIMGLRKAMEDLFGSGKPYREEMPVEEKPQEIAGKSPNDMKYERYLQRKNRLDTERCITLLLGILQGYYQEKESGQIPKDYADNALRTVYREYEQCVATGKALSEADKEMSKLMGSRFHPDMVVKPEEMITKLQGIADRYDQEAERGIHTEEYVEEARDVIIEQIEELRKQYPDALSPEVEREGVRERIPIVEYRVRPGDTLIEIATRLAGTPGKRGEVYELIKKVNPEISNIHEIGIGQKIKVPGQYIEVPRVTLEELIHDYYPGYYGNKRLREDAMFFLKYLAGKDHRKSDERNKIKPGQIILVPVVGTEVFDG